MTEGPLSGWRRVLVANPYPPAVFAVVLFVGGIWFITHDEPIFGAFVLLYAGMCASFSAANRELRGRLMGEPRPLIERPYHRYQAWIFGVAAIGFLSVGVWSLVTNYDAALEVLSFTLAAALLTVVVVRNVLLRRLRRRDTG